MGRSHFHLYLVILAFFFVKITNASSSCPVKCRCNKVSIRCVDRELTVIPDFKRIVGKPTILDLSYNDIEEVHTAHFFSVKLNMVQYLHLNDNSIFDVEATSFSSLINLQYLDLSNNLLENIPSRIISKNTKLDELNLSGNIFSSRTPVLISSSLRILNLSNSKISTFVETNIKGLSQLRILYLQVNNLKHIDYKIFHNVKLNYTDLSYNSWECNCQTLQLFSHLIQTGIVNVDKPIQCMYPNKWYEDIYNAKGHMHHKRLCNKTHHEADSLKLGVADKANSLNLELDQAQNSEDMNNKTEPKNEAEDFALKYGIIIVGTIIVLVVILIIVLIMIRKIWENKLNFSKTNTENGNLYRKVTNDSELYHNVNIHSSFHKEKC